MTVREFLVVCGTVSFVVASYVPASAQVVDDFLCSTFSYKCQVPPPPPPMVLAPANPTAPEKPVKRVVHKKKKVVAKRTPATATPAAPASTAAPQ